MRPTELQQTRKMIFKEAYDGWHSGKLTQVEAARLLGMCDRSLRRYLARYEESELEALIDSRLEQVSQRHAPVDEVMRFGNLYRGGFGVWNVRHFHSDEGSAAGDDRLRWRVPAAFRTAQLWTLADVGFSVQRSNSFENEARKCSPG